MGEMVTKLRTSMGGIMTKLRTAMVGILPKLRTVMGENLTKLMTHFLQGDLDIVVIPHHCQQWVLHSEVQHCIHRNGH